MSPGRFAVVLGPAAALTDELPYSAAARCPGRRCSPMTWSRPSSGCPAACFPSGPDTRPRSGCLPKRAAAGGKGASCSPTSPTSRSPTQVISDLVEDVVTWRRDGYQPGAHRRRYGQQMAVRDLIDRPRPLVVSGRPASPRERAGGRATGGSRDITGTARNLTGSARPPPPTAATWPPKCSPPPTCSPAVAVPRCPAPRSTARSSERHPDQERRTSARSRPPCRPRYGRGGWHPPAGPAQDRPRDVRPGLSERAAHRARRHPGHHDPPAGRDGRPGRLLDRRVPGPHPPHPR